MWSGPAALYVLLALADGPAHGLGIAENVAQFTEDRVILGPGTLYRVLRDLNDGDLITRIPSPEPDHPHRKYYALTAAGHSELRSAYAELKLVTSTAASRLA